MKLTCVIETSDRHMASLCLGKKRKPCTGLLSLGYEPGKPNVPDNLGLLVCTLQNKTGTKYKILKNIETVFSKFTGEGRATIRLRLPPHDLLISKADPLSLKSFLKVFHNILAGNGASFGTTLSKLAPATTTQVQAPRTKLAVISPAQWQQSLSYGLERSLSDISITDCRLKSIDPRIFRLPTLKQLNISRNDIDEFPAQLGGLTLHTLVFAENKLTSLPRDVFSDTKLGASLLLLDLRANQLTAIPETVCDMPSLAALHLNGNVIAELPTRLGNMRRLRTLIASHNRLTFLPLSARLLRLEVVDVSENLFSEDVYGECLALRKVERPPTLLELSFRSVIGHRVKFGEEDLPSHLHKIIERHQLCLCGRPFVESSYPFRGQLDLRTIAGSVVHTRNSNNLVPVKGSLCRPSCK